MHHEDMHHADITAALKKTGSSQAEVARRVGVTYTAVCGVIHGRFRSRRIERAIARAAKKPVSELWPSRGAA